MEARFFRSQNSDFSLNYKFTYLAILTFISHNSDLLSYYTPFNLDIHLIFSELQRTQSISKQATVRRTLISLSGLIKRHPLH